ncbi:hypothetical protein [Haloechinothrix salitolerans]|uniref:Mce-associated membrane protein n=1 Tax=Haloechinothrix salitolerans TaxID=926830 RepID=A0ABW2C5L7_9PSEU
MTNQVDVSDEPEAADEPELAHEPDSADEPDDADAGGGTDRAGRSWITVGLAVVIVLAVAAGVWFAIRLATAASGADQDAAEERDAALAAGGGAVVTLNTLDHRTAEDGIARWQAASTGVLREQLAASEEDLIAAVREAKSKTTAHLVAAALTERGQEEARLMAVLDIKVRPAGEEPTTKRVRYIADLVKVDGEWRLGGLSPVAVEK